MKNQTTNVSLWRTKDQYLASTLYAIGLKLDSSEWFDNACFFVFENEQKCQEVVKKYYAGELRVDPRDLWEGFKTIKSIINPLLLLFFEIIS